jgi:hypothetical protein
VMVGSPMAYPFNFGDTTAGGVSAARRRKRAAYCVSSRTLGGARAGDRPAILLATPVTASPAFIVVAAALATAVGVSASQQPYETWQYTSTYGWVGGARNDVATVEQPLSSRSGTSQPVVSACRDALMRLAQPHDLASMEVVGDGKPRRVNGRTCELSIAFGAFTR